MLVYTNYNSSSVCLEMLRQDSPSACSKKSPMFPHTEAPIVYSAGRRFTLLVLVGSPGEEQVLAVSGLSVSVTKSILFSKVSQMCVGQWE